MTENGSLALNLAEAFDRQVERNPDGLALVFGDRAWTRREIDELSGRAVALLTEHGVKAGDRVIAQYDTTAEDVALAIAVARVGGTLMPVPKRLGMREVNYLLEKSEAALFSHAGVEPAEGLSPPPGAAVISASSIWNYRPTAIGTAAMEDDHCALIGVTSGSTGQPKGVMHGWRGIAWTAERVRAQADVRPDEAIMVTGAGAGAPGFTLFTYMGLATGATIVKAPKWDPAEVLRLAVRHDCVWSCMVPTMLRMLLDARAEALGEGRLEKMRAITMGGGFMSEELIHRARSELGVEVLRVYAMAECMVNAAMSLEDSVDDRDALDGRSGPGAELAIFNDERERLPVGETGEIGLKGPSLLLGYLAEPEAKPRLMTPDGFFLSGDIGRLDQRGYVKVVGRKKDMINRGGYKIDPSEVEELICRHPAVAKAVVVGYPDPLFGERACAVIECRERQSVEARALLEFLLGQGLSKEKLPERFEWREALPLSPDGKILKAAIKAEVGTNPQSGLGQ